ncbi:MAG: phosphopentomutase [Eubacteriaceae bacterium]|nr:phosphopentomutase [Eubacteriaceae bacterium]
MKRVILIVLDSFGVGELPDADRFGDKGADTFGHIVDSVPGFDVPEMRSLGLGNIKNAAGGRLAVENPKGAYGRLKELSAGKDTITGHWEIAGVETTMPFKTYPNGFPDEFIKAFEKAIGRKVLGNYAASGTVIIEDLGNEHEATGCPIVYTSADSVFQIAADTDVIPLKELYSICETARKMLHGKFACGRVIARPYIKIDGKRVRTSDRHDYAVSPPEKTVLDYIKEAGKEVAAVGKINDIFNGRGITKTVHTESNMDGVDKTLEYMKENFTGLIFSNLVDFDSKYGHRRDPAGYGKALMDLDKRLPEIIAAMKDTDVLMLCADHGNDPVHSGFDHTREYIPLVVFGKEIKPTEINDRDTFADIGETIAEILDVQGTHKGKSFLSSIKKQG